MQRAEDTRGLIVLIRSPNTLYIYILYIYIYILYIYIYILYIYILYIYILYIPTVPHLYIQPYDGMARSFQWREAFNFFRGLQLHWIYDLSIIGFLPGTRGGYRGNIYIYRTLAWNQAIDLVGWNAYMVWVIFLAIYPSGYIPFQPAHPL